MATATLSQMELDLGDREAQMHGGAAAMERKASSAAPAPAAAAAAPLAVAAAVAAAAAAARASAGEQGQAPAAAQEAAAGAAAADADAGKPTESQQEPPVFGTQHGLGDSQVDVLGILHCSQGLSQGLPPITGPSATQGTETLTQEALRAEQIEAAQAQAKAAAAAVLRGGAAAAAAAAGGDDDDGDDDDAETEAEEGADGSGAETAAANKPVPAALARAKAAGAAHGSRDASPAARNRGGGAAAALQGIMTRVSEAMGANRDSPAGIACRDQLNLLAEAAASQEEQLLAEQEQTQMQMQQQLMEQHNDQWAAALAASMPPFAWDPSQAAMYPAHAYGFWPGMDPSAMQGQPQRRHASLAKPEHAASNAKRRGPMDEMRQLQRILAKLLPSSIMYMPNQDGGGNKVQADDIKVYLAATLGDAPKPDWGLKNGWGQYLADLFNWAMDKEGAPDAITRMQAMECARRPQGRSWEVVYDKLMALGVYSWNWDLPLRKEQVVRCPKTPPPELTKQQEAVAAAAAAAAAAKAVAAGAPLDSVAALPAVQGLASVLGKRPPPLGVPALTAPLSLGALGLSSPATAPSAAASGAGSMDERVLKQARSVSSSPLDNATSRAAAVIAAAEAADAAVAAAGASLSPIPAAGAAGLDATMADASGVTAALAEAAGGGAGAIAAVSGMPMVTAEFLQHASFGQLIDYVAGVLSESIRACQAKAYSIASLQYAPDPTVADFDAKKDAQLNPLFATLMTMLLQTKTLYEGAEQQQAQAQQQQQGEQQGGAAKDEPSDADAAAGQAPASKTVSTAGGASTRTASDDTEAGAAGEPQQQQSVGGPAGSVDADMPDVAAHTPGAQSSGQQQQQQQQQQQVPRIGRPNGLPSPRKSPGKRGRGRVKAGVQNLLVAQQAAAAAAAAAVSSTQQQQQAAQDDAEDAALALAALGTGPSSSSGGNGGGGSEPPKRRGSSNRLASSANE